MTIADNIIEALSECQVLENKKKRIQAQAARTKNPGVVVVTSLDVHNINMILWGKNAEVAGLLNKMSKEEFADIAEKVAESIEIE